MFLLVSYSQTVMKCASDLDMCRGWIVDILDKLSGWRMICHRPRMHFENDSKVILII